MTNPYPADHPAHDEYATVVDPGDDLFAGMDVMPAPLKLVSPDDTGFPRDSPEAAATVRQINGERVAAHDGELRAKHAQIVESRVTYYRADREAKEQVEAERAAADTPHTGRRSWKPVDLTAVLDGTYEPPQPTVGRRHDGVGMFYPGRVHTIASESEAGKTWLALLAALAELEAGNAVVYIDFEDDEAGVVGRLMAMGAKREDVRDRFVYIKPEEALTLFDNRKDLAQVIGDMRPTLTLLDGVTEAMSLHGMEMKDNTDIARFGKMLPRWIADQGSATVALDHVVKDRESRGRYAIGGVHKINGLNGAGYTLDNRHPFGIGLTGKSTVLITKDRPAQLRRLSLPSREGLFWYADLVIKSHGDTFVEPALYAPQAKNDSDHRPTIVMAKVSKILAANPSGLSKNAIETMAGGKATVVRTALELLVTESYARQEKKGAAQVHFHVKTFHVDPAADDAEVSE